MQIPTSTQAQVGFFLLSQTHLNLLTTCPRKFQHVYLDQLGLPSFADEQERQVLGTQFHQLMQQRELGLPITEFLQEAPQLQRWFDAFVSSPPEVLMQSGLQSAKDYRDSEHQRTLCWQNYLLTGIYDLLILRQDQAQILDWKTYTRPKNSQWLQQNWQTRLYPFLLAETSDYRPEQISMTYWFAESQGEAEPQSLTFPYNAQRHAQTYQDLDQILSSLTSWLELYRQGSPLPQVPAELGECGGLRKTGITASNESWCRFAIRCQRRLDSQAEVTLSRAIDQIKEFPL